MTQNLHDDKELLLQIRSIMREWEGMFPFPEPEEAGHEAEIAHNVPIKIVALIRARDNALLDAVLAEVIGGNDIVEFGDPLLSPTMAGMDARSRDKLRAEQRKTIETIRARIVLGGQDERRT